MALVGWKITRCAWPEHSTTVARNLVSNLMQMDELFYGKLMLVAVILEQHDGRR